MVVVVEEEAELVVEEGAEEQAQQGAVRGAAGVPEGRAAVRAAAAVR